MPVVAVDNFSDRTLGLNSGAVASVAVTPSDTDQLAAVTRAIYIGVAGDVTMLLANDSSSVLFKAMPVGLYYLRVKQIKATGTAATNIVALV